MNKIAFIVICLCAATFFKGIADFPDFGDPSAPAARHLSVDYIEKSVEQTAVPNVVTAVLADYRGYDTMFETTVIFSAGIACLFLLRVFAGKEKRTRLYRHIATGLTLRIDRGGRIPESSRAFEQIDSDWVPYDMINKNTARIVIPFILIFALYVIAHGHHSPGGGFQGGVILGAAVILFALSHNLRVTLRHLPERVCAVLCAVGVMIYVGVGVICLVLGGNFLDYSYLAPVLGVDPVMARSHGILFVEIGVGIAVMAVMITLYYNLSSVGRHHEGL